MSTHNPKILGILATMKLRMPTLFDPARPGPARPVPLAVGIRPALLKAVPELSEHEIGSAMCRWGNRIEYLKALVAGADRYDLDGVQGVVTPRHAQRAADILADLSLRAEQKAQRVIKHRETAIRNAAERAERHAALLAAHKAARKAAKAAMAAAGRPAPMARRPASKPFSKPVSKSAARPVDVKPPAVKPATMPKITVKKRHVIGL
jgi:sRNA-binding protein